MENLQRGSIKYLHILWFITRICIHCSDVSWIHCALTTDASRTCNDGCWEWYHSRQKDMWRVGIIAFSWDKELCQMALVMSVFRCFILFPAFNFQLSVVKLLFFRCTICNSVPGFTQMSKNIFVSSVWILIPCRVPLISFRVSKNIDRMPQKDRPLPEPFLFLPGEPLGCPKVDFYFLEGDFRNLSEVMTIFHLQKLYNQTSWMCIFSILYSYPWKQHRVLMGPWSKT